MGIGKPPRCELGGFSCVVMSLSFAKYIIAQVPDEMQVMRYCRLGAVFLCLHNITLKGDSFSEDAALDIAFCRIDDGGVLRILSL